MTLQGSSTPTWSTSLQRLTDRFGFHIQIPVSPGVGVIISHCGNSVLGGVLMGITLETPKCCFAFVRVDLMLPRLFDTIYWGKKLFKIRKTKSYLRHSHCWSKNIKSTGAAAPETPSLTLQCDQGMEGAEEVEKRRNNPQLKPAFSPLSAIPCQGTALGRLIQPHLWAPVVSTLFRQSVLPSIPPVDGCPLHPNQ